VQHYCSPSPRLPLLTWSSPVVLSLPLICSALQPAAVCVHSGGPIYSAKFQTQGLELAALPTRWLLIVLIEKSNPYVSTQVVRWISYDGQGERLEVSGRPDNFNPSISLPPSTQHLFGLQLAPTILSDGRRLGVNVGFRSGHFDNQIRGIICKRIFQLLFRFCEDSWYLIDSVDKCWGTKYWDEVFYMKKCIARIGWTNPHDRYSTFTTFWMYATSRI
jgi:hypothetical protein